jgi:RluA family pseudouridine synthase
VNIAAYKFVALAELQSLRDRLRRCCAEQSLRGTILLSSEGINLFLAGSRQGIDAFLELVRSIDEFHDLEVKESYSQQQPFNRMLVKLKREIIAFGVEGIAPAERTSPKLSARELKAWLDAGRPVRLLDTRNDYEVDLGTFRGAERLGIRHFREFPQAAAAQLPEQAKDEPLVMFCTGGIRCEKAGPMLEKLGFRQVYQLDGGILKYFEECGGQHYDGGCFVFDSRVVLDPQLRPTGAVQCFRCQSVLTHEDIQSPQFEFGRSCPHCYRTPEQQQRERLAERQSQLVELASSQPGAEPYDNRRLIHVPRRLAGLPLIEFLVAHMPSAPRQKWLDWIDDGSLTFRGEPVDPAKPVREGQQFVHIERGFTEPPVAANIGLLFEDEWLVVVDKPAPLPVHPSGRFNRHTLQWLMGQVYRPEKLRVAHRLDANTTGLVVLCRKYASSRVLQPQFASSQVRKSYLLRVAGHPQQEGFRCEEPISTEPDRVGARSVCDSGQAAQTEFRVLERRADGTALLEATPLTGRTNQIRIHAWHLGMPIVGDPLYLPGRELGHQQTLDIGAAPLCLHAWKLAFTHPVTGQSLDFTSPPPAWSR